MHVIRAESAGFCLGVSLALQHLDKALSARATASRQAPTPNEALPRLITLGPIIHNPLVMDEYAQKGVLCLDDLDGILPGDQVVIRAHGIPREVEARLKAIGAAIVDATCPKVKKAQLAIAGQSSLGKILLLFGEADHPEVQGLIGYANGRAHVFGSLQELEELPLDAGKDWFLAAQTTQDRGAFEEAARLVRRRLGRDIPVLSTICNATRTRQEEAEALAAQVDIMVVVGGRNSGNTRRLVEVAAARGTPVVHVEQASDLDPRQFVGLAVVGLTAGASTPERHIADVESRLRAFNASPA